MYRIILPWVLNTANRLNSASLAAVAAKNFKSGSLRCQKFGRYFYSCRADAQHIKAVNLLSVSYVDLVKYFLEYSSIVKIAPAV